MRYTKLVLIIFLSVFFPNNVFSEENIISELQKGGKIIFIRHALAPGNGDPDNIDLKDCSTQRNLDSQGIEQSKKIGEFFIKNNIPIDIVLSSEWCRCKDTAKNAFGEFKTFNALNSFFSSKFAKNRDQQMKDLKSFVKRWNGKENIIFVTHYVVIGEALNTNVSSGEIAIADKSFNLIGTIETKY